MNLNKLILLSALCFCLGCPTLAPPPQNHYALKSDHPTNTVLIEMPNQESEIRALVETNLSPKGYQTLNMKDATNHSVSNPYYQRCHELINSKEQISNELSPAKCSEPSIPRCYGLYEPNRKPQISDVIAVGIICTSHTNVKNMTVVELDHLEKSDGKFVSKEAIAKVQGDFQGIVKDLKDKYSSSIQFITKESVIVKRR